LLYPKKCPLCDKTLVFLEDGVCDICEKNQPKVVAPFCMKCGKTVEDVEQEYCADCVAIPKSFEKGYPAFSYRDGIKDAIYAFKYKNQRYYAEYFSDSILQLYKEELQQLNLDGIVPVPVHKYKKRQRGYNQAEVLADCLAKELQLPMYPSYLLRVENTNPQKELNDKIRIKNLKNAFKIGENAIELKKVLLVDDIYTSGATIEACTRILLEAGVQKVYYTSVAIGKGYSG